MEILVFMKQAAEIGLTAPVIIGLGMAWQINKSFTLIDRRLAIVETKLNIKAA